DDFCAWYKGGKKQEGKRNIRNTSFIENEVVVHNKTAPRIKNLDEVGILDLSDFDTKSFPLVDGIIKGFNIIPAGRGCPFRCTFCLHIAWKEYSYRSVDFVIEEMVQRWKRYGIKLFFILDDTFAIFKERAIEFCKKLINEKYGFKWHISSRIPCMDEELLTLFKQAGCMQITYGVESLDDYTLKKIEKGYTARRVYEVIEMTNKVGMPIYVNLMTGFPWQTVDSVYKDINFVRKMGKYINAFCSHAVLVPFPGTTIYEEYAIKEGFTGFWLRPKFQFAGISMCQNVLNPYAVSTYWQRNLYDDTYVAEDYFFKFTKAYKRAVAYLGAHTGWNVVNATTKSWWQKYMRFSLGIASRLCYEFSPTLEKRIVGKISLKNRYHQRRSTARYIKY
ncbi:unnamed protein product, partial [marine sediment metagenome]